jgi:uncharacterized protein (TIGR00251 family)
VRASLEILPGSTGQTPACTGLRVYGDGARLCVGVRVSPSAPRTDLRGLHGDRLKVAVAAPAEDNRANRELEDSLAAWLHIKQNSVSVVKGHASRDKVVAFTNLEESRLRELLGAALSKCRVTGDDGVG